MSNFDVPYCSCCPCWHMLWSCSEQPSIVNLLKSNGITNIRIFDTDATTLESFSGTGINLMVDVPTECLPSLASGNANSSLEWLLSNIFSHIPTNQVKYIAVGNEVFLKDPFYTYLVVPAIMNLYQALQILNLASSIKLSSPQAASVLSNSYPPSSGTFDVNLQFVIISLLQFLKDTQSPFMVNVYSYISYINNPSNIPLDYALFRSQNAMQDGTLMYDNLFDASIHAFVYAMEKEGFAGINIVVSETGWPTAGGDAASVSNALAYNEIVVRRLVNYVGTPKRPNGEVKAYLFDLYDENGKDGEEYEKHFGIFRLDGIKVYDLNFNRKACCD